MRYWLLILSTVLLSACSHPDREAVDRLAEGYADGQAEALNNLAFVNILRMQYEKAERLLDSIPLMTDNQVELLIAHIQQMRLCQRQSRNRDFYDYRQQAMSALERIDEERALLSERQQRRMVYAESELAIVNSTYYYYVGLEQKSVEALEQMPEGVERDTAQWLNYMYNVGAGGIITEGSQQDICQQELDLLMRCFQIAQQHGYPFFAANAMEALSEHLIAPENRTLLADNNAAALKLINPEEVDCELLPVWLADNALAIFREFGDTYQIAGAYRTLASCYRAMGDYESALFNLEQALSDSTILQAPDLVASIREQLSVAYAAINDKAQSDENRNLYLDLQEQTRQDRQLEARADQLDRTVSQLNLLMAAVIAAILLLLFLLWLFNHLNKRQRPDEQLDSLLEEKREQLDMGRLIQEKSERINLEQRAKVSLAVSVTPLIDRMIHEAGHIEKMVSRQTQEGGEPLPAMSALDSIEYIRELTDQINADNEVLTHWIQLRRGDFNLHIESFALQPLFDMVARGKTGFQLKGLTLEVMPTGAVVKADRILTLFMLNTLADNARKFTPEGGKVTIAAEEAADYVEVSVSDTGIGMSDSQLDHLFDRKPISDDKALTAVGGGQASHGFGLMNCKGIIEKYRKLSQVFAVCTLQAESRQGKGSRLSFRLPRGVAKVIGGWLTVSGALLSAAAVQAAETQAADTQIQVSPMADDSPLSRAAVYADSAFFSNINGTYERTLLFADSCRYFLNLHYLNVCPKGETLMLELGNTSAVPAEISWYHDSIATNYDVILDIRNESAVAALALHRWQDYSYNNRIYTLLFKELSADNTLSNYCRTMQQSQTNKTIALVVLLLVLIAILPAYYLLYLRHRLYKRFQAEMVQRQHVENLEDEIRRTQLEQAGLHVSNAVLDNCLSTLKHETMYYPSRIRQLADQGDMASLTEVAVYYRELYGLLTEQAMSQVERAQLRLKALEPTVFNLPPSPFRILGDENLLRYLFEILKKQGGQKRMEATMDWHDAKYVGISVSMPGMHLSDAEAARLFTPSVENIPYLLCRQIVRDHGEATNRRGCSIRGETGTDGVTRIVITLPRAYQQ